MSFKEWLEAFAKENNIELAKIYDGLNLFDKELLGAKNEVLSELNALKEQKAELLSIFDSIKNEFGFKGDDLKGEILALLNDKGKKGEADLNGLKAEIQSLKDSLAKEKSARSEAVRKNRLNKILESLTNLNADHKEIVEIKLNNAFKIDESGKEYFEKDGTAIEPKAFLDSFFKENEKYIKPQGVAGNGVNGEFAKGISDKKFSEMSLSDRAILFKTNPAEYERLKNLGE